MINLLDVSGQDDFRAFPRSRDDCFDFMRREILRFVNDEEDSLQTATANVSQRSHFEFVFE